MNKQSQARKQRQASQQQQQFSGSKAIYRLNSTTLFNLGFLTASCWEYFLFFGTMLMLAYILIYPSRALSSLLLVFKVKKHFKEAKGRLAELHSTNKRINI